MKTTTRQNTSSLARAFAFALSFVFANRLVALEVPLDDDTYIDNYSTTDTVNYGRAATLRCYLSGSRLIRPLLRFALTADTFPAGTTAAQISQATLRLWVGNTSGVLGTIQIARVTSDWQEIAVTNISAPTINLDLAPAIPTLVPISSESEFVFVDITPWVKAWMSGTPNYGIALIAKTPASGATMDIQFDSKESTAASHEPVLELELTAAPRLLPRGDISMGTFMAGPQP